MATFAISPRDSKSAWVEDDTLVYRLPQANGKPSGKVFGTDLIGTIIQAKNGDSMPRGEHDWVWCSDAIPMFLEQKHRDGYTIVIFSNYFQLQAAGRDMVKKRFEAMLKQLSFEPHFYASMRKDNYSKPQTGMWDLFRQHHSGDIKELVYTGDRYSLRFPDRKSKDHSTADINFALAIGAEFRTPFSVYPQQPSYVPNPKTVKLIIMVGVQGAGKSTAARRLLSYPGMKDVKIVERNNKKHIAPLTSELRERRSVIFDATNPTIAARADIIKIGQENKVDEIVIL